MARRKNYAFDKAQRDRAKRAKREAKKAARQAKREEAGAEGEAGGETAAETVEGQPLATDAAGVEAPVSADAEPKSAVSADSEPE